ncbi:MAG: bpX6 domain-containing protein [Aquihabitans sp.]
MRRKPVLPEDAMEAAAFVVDAPLLGEQRARARALGLHRPGTTYAVLDDGRWLVRLPAPERTQPTSAPGLPLTSAGGALVAEPERRGPIGAVVVPVGGASRTIEAHRMTPVDPVSWVDLGELEVVSLVPSTAPPPPASEADDRVPPVDLRRKAAVGTPSRRAQQVLEEAAARSGPGSRRRTGGERGSGEPKSRPQPWRDRVLTAIARSPLGGEIGKRHERYLRDLALQFSRRDYDEALRNAIAVGGPGGSGLTLRLPSRRNDLQMRRTVARGGRSVPLGPSVDVKLRDMYRAAAEDLEAAGRVEEAAFVYADLLEDVPSAIAVLERGGRLEDGARLAEDRLPTSPDAVRLWWLAGHRDRAVWLARRRNHFAVVVSRLETTDAEAATALRLEWVAALEASGAVGTAVAVGWADPALRPLLGNLISRGIELDGPDAAALRAHRVALLPTDEVVEEVEDRLAEWADAKPDELRAFVLALADAPIADAAVDRRVASAAIRADAATAWPVGGDARSRVLPAVGRRADPLLVADLPPMRPRRRPERLDVGPSPAGAVAVFDAVGLPSGRTLLALGALGCRLITDDGRTVAQWDVPTHQLVPADHGGMALLLAPRGDGAEVHALDLGSRRIQRYGGVAGSSWVPTCDGSTWSVLDERGLAFYDLHADRPRVGWRELDEVNCLRLARSDLALAALVQSPYNGLEVMRWDPRSVTLIGRSKPSAPMDSESVVLTPDGSTHWVNGGGSVTTIPGHGARTTNQLREGGRLLAAGDHLVQLWPEGDSWKLDAGPFLDPGDRSVTIEMGAVEPTVHALGGRLAACDATGRVVVVDLGSRTVVSRVAVVG